MLSCNFKHKSRQIEGFPLFSFGSYDFFESILRLFLAERRCDGLAVFVKEETKRLGGPFEVDMYVNISLEECQNLCLRAEK